MKIIPKYPKSVTESPFYIGIIIGFLFSVGYSTILFNDSYLSLIYGSGILALSIVYYYYKHKEFM